MSRAFETFRATIEETERDRDIYFATKVQLSIINLRNQQMHIKQTLSDQESGRDFSVFGSTNSCWHMQLAKLRVVVCEVTVLHPIRLQVLQSFASITYSMLFFTYWRQLLLNFTKERVLMFFGKEFQILTPLYFIEFWPDLFLKRDR